MYPLSYDLLSSLVGILDLRRLEEVTYSLDKGKVVNNIGDSLELDRLRLIDGYLLSFTQIGRSRKSKDSGYLPFASPVGDNLSKLDLAIGGVMNLINE